MQSIKLIANRLVFVTSNGSEFQLWAGKGTDINVSAVKAHIKAQGVSPEELSTWMENRRVDNMSWDSFCMMELAGPKELVGEFFGAEELVEEEDVPAKKKVGAK